ncbi:Regulatory protein MLP and related LIM proteins [Plasmopara halstedii]|uniref:Regulatory protein MLP and related LIM proteins n=1 Tax=Plasmopara halstedii TaxID=4781 RepID=A0A0P1AJ71_PLAHL|nr:Regulatory protein MLP and related LIM proteins [Plasmopara halstedii]CEG40908.1 Regulatory protein MLP and related LIM proteins [Plasmopara halstedii]|eukprot:XP_024577277.1 Regulatory protein MLP and related LIM proteins [Plasmopara halstedii]
MLARMLLLTGEYPINRLCYLNCLSSLTAMATLKKTNLPLPCSSERSLPTQHQSRAFVDERDFSDAYIIEDVIHPHGLHVPDPVHCVKKDDHHAQSFLNYSSGESDFNSDNSNEESRNEMIHCINPQPRRHHTSSAASDDIDTDRLVQIMVEETERKQKARAEKELAWKKWRRDTQRPCRYGQVARCLVFDSSLARTNEDVEESTDKNPAFTRHIDRMSNKIARLLSYGQIADDERSNSFRSPTSPAENKANPKVGAGRSSTQTALYATLKQLTQTIKKAELSEAGVSRISAYLVLIDQIVSEDTSKKNGQNGRGLHRLSRTQWSRIIHDSSERVKELCEPMTPSKQLAISSEFPVLGENIQPRVVSTVLSSFKAFNATKDLGDTLTTFNTLLQDCGLDGVQIKEPWHVYCHIKSAVYSKLGFRHKQLFKLLDERYCLDAYKRKPVTRKRLCIIGAGPVGLRGAIEAALLGGQVIVLEKRDHFSRENMLHLWPWVIQDLLSLGAKVFFPQFCKTNTHFHISMRQLQVVLLKIALLVGVTVYSSTEFESIVPPGRESSGGKPYYMVTTQPQISTMEFTAVLGASGANDNLAKLSGINRFVYNSNESLGILCYFPNLGTSEEMKAKEFSWTSKLKHPMLDKLRDLGIDLENVVYYRGEMHYLVMTPKRQNLLEFHVLKENRSSLEDLVKQTNVNERALQLFVKEIVNFAGIPRKADFTRVSLLDFSSLTRADKAATILSSHGKKLYVGLIGDSLQEPEWHEGVGTSSGFLSALDCVWMVAQIGKKSDEQILADRQAAYQVTMRLSSTQREDMQKNVRKYTVDPSSRYTI